MSDDTIHTALRSVMTIHGVTGYVTVSKDKHHTSTEAPPPPAMLVRSVVSLARALLVASEDRRTDLVMDRRVAMRRIDGCVACVIADPDVASEADLQRKLSALAIRAQSQSSQEPPSPVIPVLRELYIGAAGPLSALVFDRAIEQLKIARKARSLDAIRELMESLAGPITPVWVKTQMLERVNAAITEAAKQEPARPPAPPRTPSFAPPPRVPSSPPPGNLRPIVVVAQVARDVVGASSDSSVQNAVELFGRLDSQSANVERLVAMVAAELPELSRSRFVAEARTRLGGLGTVPAQR